MSPCWASAIAIATVAAELWMTAVRTIDASAIAATPSIESADMRVKTAEKSGFALMGATPFAMK